MRLLVSILCLTMGVLFASWFFSACSDASASEGLPKTVSYNFDIRPILSDKCFACHGPDPNTREANLRLDDPEAAFAALKDNPNQHAIVAGHPELSHVYLRLTDDDPTRKMPPPASNLQLSSLEIQLIEKWIKQGAKYEAHWAFTPPVSPQVPAVKNKKWPKNEIDQFILAKLESLKLQPNEKADKERLLKRLSFDLTGLPPSIEMMDAFLQDVTDNAYEKVVNELMNMPAYGEKMAIHWLDIARYADSHGYQDDGYRTQWPWRDWVIHAYNTNMPYSDFVTWQLAGDLIPEASKEQILATGFNRNHKITEEGGVIPEEYRSMYVSDRTDLFGKALLGITLECSKCHDHKYDPFSQKEYFQVYAFFNNINEKGIESVIGGPETYAKQPFMEISNKEVDSILTFVNKQDTNRLIVSIMGDLPVEETRKTFILNRGEYDQPGDEVEAGTPKSVLNFKEEYPKNRLGLSKWLFDKDNPLTARVYVNILWQEFFGQGIVKTSGDFGMQGELPSHPELLDWLAVDFINSNWDIKRLITLMVTSATYQQSASSTKNKLDKDPENMYLSRGPRYRVHAEFVRDIVLASSGLLNTSIGGPSVKPYQPEGLWEGATSGRGILSVYVQDKGEKLYRRGMYTLIKRTVPPPVMSIFDASPRDVCEVKRLKTNTPLQALVMMNDPTILEASRVLSANILQEKSTIDEKINKAFRKIVCRIPDKKESDILLKYYHDQLATLDKEKAEIIINVGEYPASKTVDVVEHAALMRVITTIYNLEETITKT